MSDTSPFLAMVKRMIRAAGRRVAHADPTDLAELAAIRFDIERAIQEAVDGLREDGFTWDAIAESLNVTRQAAIKRWGNDTNKGHRRNG
jgi:hypothetical protein